MEIFKHQKFLYWKDIASKWKHIPCETKIIKMPSFFAENSMKKDFTSKISLSKILQRIKFFKKSKTSFLYKYSHYKGGNASGIFVTKNARKFYNVQRPEPRARSASLRLPASLALSLGLEKKQRQGLGGNIGSKASWLLPFIGFIWGQSTLIPESNKLNWLEQQKETSFSSKTNYHSAYPLSLVRQETVNAKNDLDLDLSEFPIKMAQIFDLGFIKTNLAQKKSNRINIRTHKIFDSKQLLPSNKSVNSSKNPLNLTLSLASLRRQKKKRAGETTLLASLVLALAPEGQGLGQGNEAMQPFEASCRPFLSFSSKQEEAGRSRQPVYSYQHASFIVDSLIKTNFFEIGSHLIPPAFLVNKNTLFLKRAKKIFQNPQPIDTLSPQGSKEINFLQGIPGLTLKDHFMKKNETTNKQKLLNKLKHKINELIFLQHLKELFSNFQTEKNTSNNFQKFGIKKSFLSSIVRFNSPFLMSGYSITSLSSFPYKDPSPSLNRNNTAILRNLFQNSFLYPSLYYSNSSVSLHPKETQLNPFFGTKSNQYNSPGINDYKVFAKLRNQKHPLPLTCKGSKEAKQEQGIREKKQGARQEMRQEVVTSRAKLIEAGQQVEKLKLLCNQKIQWIKSKLTDGCKQKNIKYLDITQLESIFQKQEETGARKGATKAGEKEDIEKEKTKLLNKEIQNVCVPLHPFYYQKLLKNPQINLKKFYFTKITEKRQSEKLLRTYLSCKFNMKHHKNFSFLPASSPFLYSQLRNTSARSNTKSPGFTTSLPSYSSRNFNAIEQGKRGQELGPKVDSQNVFQSSPLIQKFLTKNILSQIQINLPKQGKNNVQRFVKNIKRSNSTISFQFLNKKILPQSYLKKIGFIFYNQSKIKKWTKRVDLQKRKSKMFLTHQNFVRNNHKFLDSPKFDITQSSKDCFLAKQEEYGQQLSASYAYPLQSKPLPPASQAPLPRRGLASLPPLPRRGEGVSESKAMLGLHHYSPHPAGGKGKSKRGEGVASPTSHSEWSDAKEEALLRKQTNHKGDAVAKTKILLHLKKHKNEQKKRRQKKQKRQTRRKTKRKRVYPRPLWLRFPMYKRFLKVRHPENVTKINLYPCSSIPDRWEKNKTIRGKRSSNFQSLFHIKKLLNQKFQEKLLKTRIYRSNKQKWGSSQLDYVKFEKLALKKEVYLKTLPLFEQKNFYQIPYHIKNDLKRLSLKSYWLRSNLEPYLARIQNSLDLIKESSQKNNMDLVSPSFFSEFFRGFVQTSSNPASSLEVRGEGEDFNKFGLSDSLFPLEMNLQQNRQFENSLVKPINHLTHLTKLEVPKESNLLTSKVEGGMLHKKSHVTLQNAAINLSLNSVFFHQALKTFEYKKMLQNRIQNEIQNMKENVTSAGQGKARCLKIGRSKKNFLQEKAPLNSFWNKINSVLNYSESLKNTILIFIPLTPMGLEAGKVAEKNEETVNKRRIHWALNKTNLFGFRETNSLKNLISAYKIREQKKSNSTKKMIWNQISKIVNLKQNDVLLRTKNQIYFKFNKKLQKFEERAQTLGVYTISSPRSKIVPKSKYLSILGERIVEKDLHCQLLPSIATQANEGPLRLLLPLREKASKSRGYQLRKASKRTRKNKMNQRFLKKDQKYGQNIKGFLGIQNFVRKQIQPNLKQKKWRAFPTPQEKGTLPISKHLYDHPKRLLNFWWSKKSINLNEGTQASCKNPFFSMPYLSLYPSGKPSLLTQTNLTNLNSISTFSFWFCCIFLHFSSLISLIHISEVRSLMKFHVLILYKLSTSYLTLVCLLSDWLNRMIKNVSSSFCISQKKFPSILPVFVKGRGYSFFNKHLPKIEKLKTYSKKLNIYEETIESTLYSFDFKNSFFVCQLRKPCIALALALAIPSLEEGRRGKKGQEQNKGAVKASRRIYPLINQLIFRSLYKILDLNTQKSNSSSSNISRNLKSALELHIRFSIYTVINKAKSLISRLPFFLFLPSSSLIEGWDGNRNETPLAAKGSFSANFQSASSLSLLLSEGRSKTKELGMEQGQQEGNSSPLLLKQKLKIITVLKPKRFLNKIFLPQLFVQLVDLLETVLLGTGYLWGQSIFKFLEKPTKLIIAWIADVFLLEWSSDLLFYIPDTLDLAIWTSFHKLSRGIKGTSFLLGYPFLGSLYQRRLLSFMETLLENIIKPDTDLLMRQKQGIFFWDIWADILIRAAEEYGINIPSLTTLKEEQDLLLEKLGEDRELNTVLVITKKTKRNKLNISDKNSFSKTANVLHEINPLINIIKITRPTGFFSVSQLSLSSLDLKQTFIKHPQKKQNQMMTRVGNKGLRWSLNQSFSYESRETDLFLDIHPPKSFRHFHIFKRSVSNAELQPVAQMVCQIYSGMLLKQVSKNLLVIGSPSTAGLRGNQSGKSMLIQAIAGETELKIISDHAQRYATVSRGIAVGMKLLREVFDALALHAPCLFLMEDIHLIGERRPLLISDDENAKAAESGGANLGFEREEVHEKNQVIYQLNKHSISHYKKPYKGDFSLLIPTNHFCFDLFLGVNKEKKRRSGPVSPLPISYLENEIEKDTEKGKSSSEVTHKTAGSPSSFPITQLQLKTEALFAPPATSPFTVFILKEQKKLKPRKIVQQLPWGGISSGTGNTQTSLSQDETLPKSNYSVRAKISLLADMAISNLSAKLDRITDLLVIIDSVRSQRGFIVFATTHIPFVLDPALRRPGRLDETISIPALPNIINRFEILKTRFSSTNFFSLPFTNSKEFTFDLMNFSTLLENLNETEIDQFIHHQKLLLFTLPNNQLVTKLNFVTNLQKTSFCIPVPCHPSLLQSNAGEERARDNRNSSTKVPNSSTKVRNSSTKVRNFSNATTFISKLVGSQTKVALHSLTKSTGLNSSNQSSIFTKYIQSWTGLSTEGAPKLLEISKHFLNSSNGSSKNSVNIPFMDGLKQKVEFQETSWKSLNSRKTQQNSYSYRIPLNIRSIAYFQMGKFIVNSLIFNKRKNENFSKTVSYKKNYNNGKHEKNQIRQNNIKDKKVGANFKIITAMHLWPGGIANTSNTLISSREVPLENTSAVVFQNLYSSNSDLKNQIIQLFAGRIGEFFAYNGGRAYTKQFSLNLPYNQCFNSSYKTQVSSGLEWSRLEGINHLWRSAHSLIISIFQKRYLYQKNSLAFQLLDIQNHQSLKGGGTMSSGSGQGSTIFNPAKRFENFKRTEKDFQQKATLKIYEKIQLHKQQKRIKELYQKPLSFSEQKGLPFPSLTEGIREEAVRQENELDEIALNQLEQKKDGGIVQSSSIQTYYRNRLLFRHRFYLTNLWWNGHLAEHNAETTFSSDIDWRYLFVKTKNINMGDIMIDFPDAQQHYNPRNRRWMIHSGYWGDWYTLDKLSHQEISSHFALQCFNEAYKILDENREILDYLAYQFLNKGRSKPIDLVTILSWGKTPS